MRSLIGGGGEGGGAESCGPPLKPVTPFAIRRSRLQLIRVERVAVSGAKRGRRHSFAQTRTWRRSKEEGEGSDCNHPRLVLAPRNVV
ncbi:hypothetical protein BHE74_00038118 [Ensete ventricosum]|uniref:Uncharacterized protein n=1 Tax=Ensete ventricosum TaxID=4639 RepID=A0A426XN32_ENSVE|nr:hypothetical protein B296_00038859 [Ensete ventricosum]RWW55248.1 hypothetical protein BHE74_00038118 [Ensete ventricosum]RZS14138.1 hypothetical protein BHM03_00045802 [Ensete ventricosum]